MDLDLKNKVGIITGASRGIGAEIARELAREGCSLLLTARSAAELTRLASEVHSLGGRALAHPRGEPDHEPPARRTQSPLSGLRMTSPGMPPRKLASGPGWGYWRAGRSWHRLRGPRRTRPSSRRPVAAVETNDGQSVSLTPIDVHGIRLPDADFTDVESRYLPRISGVISRRCAISGWRRTTAA